MKLELTHSVHRWAISSHPKRMKNHPKRGVVMVTSPIKFLVPLTISPERLKLETSNFVHWFARWRFIIGITNWPLSGRGHGHVTSLNFRK